MSRCGPISPELRALLDRECGHLFPDVDYTEPMIPDEKSVDDKGDKEGEDADPPNVQRSPRLGAA